MSKQKSLIATICTCLLCATSSILCLLFSSHLWGDFSFLLLGSYCPHCLLTFSPSLKQKKMGLPESWGCSSWGQLKKLKLSLLELWGHMIIPCSQHELSLPFLLNNFSQVKTPISVILLSNTFDIIYSVFKASLCHSRLIWQIKIHFNVLSYPSDYRKWSFNEQGMRMEAILVVINRDIVDIVFKNCLFSG